MCDKAVSFAGEKLLPLLLEVIKGVPKEVAEVKEELGRILASIHGADRMASSVEQDNYTRDGIKTKVKQLMEATFRLEDLAEDYMIIEEQQPRDPGCASLPCATTDFIKTMILRLRISYEIQDIKSRVREINPIQSGPSSSQQHGSSSSTVSQNVTWHSLRMKAHHVRETDVVGFEAPRDELIGWLEEKQVERTVIAVVGMGGQGKTTLAKTVYDKVIKKFDCHAWISVSQVYTIEGVLREMLKKFWERNKEDPPEGSGKSTLSSGCVEIDLDPPLPEVISEMDRWSLINKVRGYLEKKRYVVLFDDVWNKNFWSEIELAVLDNTKRSRILITTRWTEVANFCKVSSLVHIQDLKPLSPPKSWELFCKKAFLNEPDRRCPEELKDISSTIVDKCNGLPLAIIAIGGLLATKEKKSSEWQSLGKTLVSELEKNPNSTGMTNILGLSYDDLPYYLKPCFLYFGIYPEDYEVESTTLIKQWIAEGFAKNDQNKTLEKVAEQYLKELIYRSLVQVSLYGTDGEPTRCRVPDLLHKMILTKIEDLSFCHFVKDDESVFRGMIRRLKIATNSNSLMVNTEGSHTRSLYIFRKKELPEDFVRIIPTKYKLLKVLDFEPSRLSHVPENLGSLLRLRYLSFRKTNVESLPNSIGNLQFLETLDLRQTRVRQMPREINKLKKLRHLLAYGTSWGYLGYGIQMMEGVGGLESLQTLRQVDTDYCAEELIRELGKLRQLRLLGLINVKPEYGKALCSSIIEMEHLEKLYIDTKLFTEEVIDLHDISSLPVLQKLRLRGMLERLPQWITSLQNLVHLSLISSNLTSDPSESLKDMPNLLFLYLDSAYNGESLHFQDGGFKRLRKLSLRHLFPLNSILIGKGALQLLKEFMLECIISLKVVPYGIDHLARLEVFHVIDMPEEFSESMRENHWINTHVCQVKI